MIAMTPIERIHNWTILAALEKGAGYADFHVEHGFLRTRAEARVFGPEFVISPEIQRHLESFLSNIAAVPHPSVCPILEIGTVAMEEGPERPYMIRQTPSQEPLSAKIAQSPLDSRETILPFLHALGRLAIDLQGFRIAMQKLRLEDLIWDGKRLMIREIWWPALLQGSTGQRLVSLLGPWERRFPGGIYPFGDQAFSRTGTLASIGRLAYQAGGVAEPEMRIVSAFRLEQTASPSETTSSMLLMEAWGAAAESLARRCLFAHQPGMIEGIEALLDAVERLSRGEVPELCRFVPPPPADYRPPVGAAKSPEDSMGPPVPVMMAGGRDKARASAPAAVSPVSPPPGAPQACPPPGAPAVYPPPAGSQPAGNEDIESRRSEESPREQTSRGERQERRERREEEPLRKGRVRRVEEPEERERRDEEPRSRRGEADVSAPATRASTPKPFVPLGVEAAAYDSATPPALTPGAPPTAKPPAKSKRFSISISPEMKKKVMWAAAGILGLAAVIGIVAYFLGRQPSNTPPIAILGAIPQKAYLNKDVPLDASLSRDTDQRPRPMTYHWEVIEPLNPDFRIDPNNSNKAEKTTANFFKLGRHVIQLRVFDGAVYSAPVRTEIMIIEEPK